MLSSDKSSSSASSGTAYLRASPWTGSAGAGHSGKLWPSRTQALGALWRGTRMTSPARQRQSELLKATWSEINCSEALWTIQKERVKRRNPHLVFLSEQEIGRASCRERVCPYV